MADSADLILKGLPAGSVEDALRRTRLILLDLQNRVAALEAEVASLKPSGENGGG